MKLLASSIIFLISEVANAGGVKQLNPGEQITAICGTSNTGTWTCKLGHCSGSQPPYYIEDSAGNSVSGKKYLTITEAQQMFSFLSQMGVCK